MQISIGRLERQIRRMSDVENRFEYLVQREEGDVKHFRRIVRENARIEAEMKVCCVGRVFQYAS